MGASELKRIYQTTFTWTSCNVEENIMVSCNRYWFLLTQHSVLCQKWSKTGHHL